MRYKCNKVITPNAITQDTRATNDTVDHRNAQVSNIELGFGL